MKTAFKTTGLIVGLMFLASCTRETDAQPDEDRTRLTFGYSLESLAPASRSILTAPDIEDKVSTISLFIYRKDRLIASGHHEGDFSGMDFTLEKGSGYDIYALANMGDMRGRMPADKSVQPVETMIWNIPSYSFVDENGIPMAGSLEGFVAGTDEPEVPLRRLFAKVCADIDLDYPGADVKSVRIMNLNSCLRPFGESVAEGPSSIMNEAEYDSGSSTYVFYVPENMQGQIGSAVESREKNPDLDQDIRARKDVLTYMEADVVMNGESDRYTGSVTYRSYLGENATKNFDIKGNCLYSWNLTYLEDNLQYDDWKIDTGSLSDKSTHTYVLLLNHSSLDMEAGDTGTLSAHLVEFEDGVYGAMTDVTYVSSWSSSDPSVAIVVSKGCIEATGPGTCSVTVKYSGYSATCTINVTQEPAEYTYELEVSPAELDLKEGDTGTLSATYRTFTDGVLSESRDVTSSAVWSSSRSSCASVDKGQVKGIKEGSATITASYEGCSDDAAVNVSAIPVNRTYSLEIIPASLTLAVGQDGSLSAVYRTFADGVLESEETVTSVASWSSSSGTIAGISSGMVTAKAEGSATMTATYNGCSATADVYVESMPIYLEDISVSPSSVTGFNGEQIEVSVTAHYSDGSTEDIAETCTWSSSSIYIASYSSGMISCNSAGEAEITLSHEGFSATISVTVKAIGPEQMSFDCSSVTLESGETHQAGVSQVILTDGRKVRPSAADLTWVSSDPQTATVSEGLITGIKAGTTTVTGTYSSNGLSVSCDISVTVTEPEAVIPTLTSVTISGASHISLSGSTQFRATATYSDGSTQDVTSSASWYSKDGILSSVSGGCAIPLSSSSDKSGSIYCSYEGLYSEYHSITVVNNVTSVSGWLETIGGMSYFGMTVTMADGTSSRVGFDWEVTAGKDPDFVGKTGSASSVGQNYSKGSNFAIIRMTSTGTFKFLENGGVTTGKAECEATIYHSDDNT